MKRIIDVILSGVVCVAVCAASRESTAQDKAEAAPSPIIVLDTLGFWRLHQTLKPPVVQDGSRLVPYMTAQPWLNLETAEPPAGWTQREFDDSAWLRGPARVASRTPYLARLCLRGKFRVTDLAKIEGLSLSLGYHGGVIVSVNGTEVGRQHIPAGVAADKVLAEAYPLEVFVDEKGDLLAGPSTYLPEHKRTGKPTAEAARRMDLRDRTVEAMEIPRKLLRQGINVLAVDVVRAPYHKVLLEESEKVGKQRFNRYDWNTCELLRIRLTAAGGEGIEANASRPDGFQVWNNDMLAADVDMDFGDPCEALMPVRLVGARNGWFSGKVVVGSTEPLAGLKATAGDLKGPEGAAIPASAVQVRYAFPWGEEWAKSRHEGVFLVPYARYGTVMKALVESPLAEYPVPEETAGGRGGPELVPGPVVPIWVTVRVPRDAAPGTYKGMLAVGAEGETTINVPLELDVVSWTLPDPQDYRTWVELMQSPDTLAMEYGVPLWSEEHWKLIAKSMRYLNEIGSRVLYVPLIAQANLGNAESMVRWVEKGKMEFDHDFSIMDKYLDVAEQHMGKPKLVVFNVWDVYMIPREGNPTRGGHNRMVRYMEGRNQERGMGPLVTVLDPKTGETDNAYLPIYPDPDSKALWQPLMAELRRRMKARGLEQAMMIGMFTDAHPTPEDVQFFKDIAPGVPWVSHGHGGYPPDFLLHKLTPVGYQACVWYTKFADGVPTHGKTWPVESLFGWKQSQLTVAFERNQGLDAYPLTRWRLMGETNISGGQRGMGRMGADYWSVIKDDRGRRRGNISLRYPDSQWMNLNICNPVLAPGPDGPVATSLYEALREGVQECEARILIEHVLTDEALKARLGAALARECQQELDRRLLVMWKTLSNHQLGGTMFFGATGWRWTPGIVGHNWYLGFEWQEGSRRLYRLAGEVARRVARR